jgi:hypothetical protein
MRSDYSVEIVGRGGGLIYSERGRQLNFDLFWNRDEARWIFHAYGCTDDQFHPVQLSSDDRNQIVARIVEFLKARGDQVEILAECPSQPLRSIAEIVKGSVKVLEK